MTTKEQHYAVWAGYYKNISLQDRKIKACVHLEDKEDRNFWEALLTHQFPHLRFQFISYSRSLLGSNTTGCDQCLAYKDYLSNRFFICIDSDYRYLLQEPGIDASHYIVQTYTYSFENHHCYLKCLEKLCEKVTGCDCCFFDFTRFLQDYSSIVYDLYIWHLYLLKTNPVQFDKNEFTQIIDLLSFCKDNDKDLKNNGRIILNELQLRVDAKLDMLRDNNLIDIIEREKTFYSTLGLTKENVYLFVRGHNLFDLIVRLGSAVCEVMLDKEKKKAQGDRSKIATIYANRKSFEEELKQQLVFGGYPEIERIMQDINQILA